MNISGLQKTSLIDYPEKLSAVIFTSGCNFSCRFCHNPELVNPQFAGFQINDDEIFEFIKKRKKILDAIVITGGEPTIYPELIDFIKKIKKTGLLVKLDTNGTNSDMIKKLINEKLVDYIAMDIKGPLDKYEEIIGKKTDIEEIKKTVELLKKNKINYEFRTTVVPIFHSKKDFENIGKWLSGAKNFYLQQFRNAKTLDKELQKVNPYPDEKLHEFARNMKKYVKNVGIRGL